MSSMSNSSITSAKRSRRLSFSRSETTNFDPTSIGLPAGWSLTNFSELKGSLKRCVDSCLRPVGPGWSLLRMFQGPRTYYFYACSSLTLDTCLLAYCVQELQVLLRDLNLGDGENIGTADGRIALDCSVRQTRQGHFCISTTDFFFPLVDSPYMQGRIGAANVLSDLFAEGTEHVDFVLMLLAACRDMPDHERAICTREMVRGFRDACDECDAPVTGGQTVLNPWPIIGGVATSIVAEQEFIRSDGAKAGDVVILTKPLGTQVAVNVHQWRSQNNGSWKKCVDKKVLDAEAAATMMHEAVVSMARLNRNAARMMLKYGAHAATDVTGFGILGHAQNLMDNQVDAVGMDIHMLPCISGTPAVNAQVFDFRLTIGFSAETSGGLLVCIPETSAEPFCRELEELDGCPSWIIGRVTYDLHRKARITEDFAVKET